MLRPVNLYGWRAPGMRAPRNTTQFIMNQIYEDMRQQEKLERQQEALRAQQAQAASTASPEGAFGNDVPPSGGQEDEELQDTLYSFVRNPSLVFSPDPDEEKQTATSQLKKKIKTKQNSSSGKGREKRRRRSGVTRRSVMARSWRARRRTKSQRPKMRRTKSQRPKMRRRAKRLITWRSGRRKMRRTKRRR